MRLGIVVTDQRQSQLAVRVLQAALERAWSVRCFLTENGVGLIKDSGFIDMARSGKVNLSICELSVERYCADVALAELDDVLIVGGQYQDAELVRNSDKVLVF